MTYIRYQFIWFRNLRPDFRFSKYLRKIKVSQLVQLVEIHPLNWFLLVTIIALDTARNRIWNIKQIEPLFLIAAFCFNLILSVLLTVKIRIIYCESRR